MISTNLKMWSSKSIVAVLTLVGTALLSFQPTNVMGQISITQTQFNSAVTNNSSPTPWLSQYNAFIASLSKAGLTTKREVPCTGTNGGTSCPARYSDASHQYNAPCGNITGRSFYGRGYIQLTWCDNYNRASAQLGLGTALRDDPDSVASNEGRAWDTSAWFWKVSVHGKLEGTAEFGRTTKAINGGECTTYPDRARNRFAKYQNVFTAFALSGTANEKGCYN